MLLACTLSAFIAFENNTAADMPECENVRYVSDAGSDANSGEAPDAPYATFRHAVGELAIDGGVIVIVGRTTITSKNCVMPQNEKPIAVTSFYNGTDYRSIKYGDDNSYPCISLANGTDAAWDFFGEYSFDCVTFNPEIPNCILAFNYNNVTFGADIATTYTAPDGSVWFDGVYDNIAGARTNPPIILSGSNNKTGGETVAKDVTLNIESGTWQNIRFGDRDNFNRNIYAGKAVINISGGLYPPFAANPSLFNNPVMAAYQICTAKEAVITVNITGGTFNGVISAIGAVGIFPSGEYFQKGTFFLNIFGGMWNRVYSGDGNYIYTVQNDGQEGIADANVIVCVDIDKLSYGSCNSLKFVSSEALHSALFLSSVAPNITYSGFEGVYTGFKTLALPQGVIASDITSVKTGELEVWNACRVIGECLVVPYDMESGTVLTAAGKSYFACMEEGAFKSRSAVCCGFSVRKNDYPGLRFKAMIEKKALDEVWHTEDGDLGITGIGILYKKSGVEKELTYENSAPDGGEDGVYRQEVYANGQYTDTSVYFGSEGKEEFCANPADYVFFTAELLFESGNTSCYTESFTFCSYIVLSDQSGGGCIYEYGEEYTRSIGYVANQMIRAEGGECCDIYTADPDNSEKGIPELVWEAYMAYTDNN